MKSQKWDALYRNLSVETAQIFMVFYEIVIEGNGTIAEVQRELQELGVLRNEATISKIINRINENFIDESKYKVVHKSASGKWSETKMAPILKELCRDIVNRADKARLNLSHTDKNPYIHIAFSTFGLPFVHALRLDLQNAPDVGDFNMQYMNCRTKDIPHILREEISLDFALGESLKSDRDNHDDYLNKHLAVEDQIESKIVWTEEISVVCNFDESSELFGHLVGRDFISEDLAKMLPVKTVDQGVMLNFLSNLHNIELPQPILDKTAAQYLRDHKIKILIPLYDNVHTLIESFILDENESVIFSGKTVARKILDRYKFLSSKDDAHPLKLEMRYSELRFQNPNHLDKRLYRRKRDSTRFIERHPYNAFWKAAGKRQNGILER